MSTRLHIVVSVGLRDRIDGALGPGQSRSDWIRRAVEQALGRVAGSASGVEIASSAPASAEQPEVVMTPEVRRRYGATMAPQAREFRPYPKGGE